MVTRFVISYCRSLLVHVPLLICLVAADMISGEANMGTLRIMLTKPISRTNFLLAKFIATMVIHCFAGLAGHTGACLLNMLIFGTDDLFLLKSQYVVC
jgi:ABC-2 type transport system permease protein